jgi:hypothetical protein
MHALQEYKSGGLSIKLKNLLLADHHGNKYHLWFLIIHKPPSKASTSKHIGFIVFSALSLLSDLMGRAARNLYNELIGETPGHRLVTGNLSTPVN